MKHTLIVAILLLCSTTLFGQNDSTPEYKDSIKVHFIYGSRPKASYDEYKWFGGKHGGHVGIEIEKGKIFDFMPRGEFHYIHQEDNIQGGFQVKRASAFWDLFDDSASVQKTATVVIPIDSNQRRVLDSLVKAYSKKSPYDYAFWGMRCASAAYDVLAQMGIVEELPFNKMFRKIFYPKKLRKRLFKLAEDNNWRVIKRPGNHRRRWEKD